MKRYDPLYAEDALGSMYETKSGDWVSYADVRTLCFAMFHHGYDHGHNDSVEGCFKDDKRHVDSAELFGELVDEILTDLSR